MCPSVLRIGEMMPNNIAILSSLLVGLAATLGTIVIHGFVVHIIVMTLRSNPIERHRLLAARALACRCRWNDAVFLSNWRPSGMSVELCFGAASSMFAPKTVGGDRS